MQKNGNENESRSESRNGSDGWPDAEGDTALTIHIPEADALVRTPARAHVTVLYPFLPLPRIDTATRRDLTALLGATPPFTLTFREIRRWPGVLYLHPSPADPLRTLTKLIRERWPETVPYRGVFGDEGLDPHLTLVSGEGTDDIPEADFAAPLPLRSRVEALSLIVWDGPDGKGWRDAQTYPLRGSW
ncbi:2'-5' RNA ligase family protein [Streptomyces sp. SID14478]|uniref:2'-5' RNA ligase family protein n=1 Tax=Streptomyces sp. SID14478 TaxID=2706073 RepID=UPI0013DFA023|nr:2'-5' RNA ligase family protein [Streptomyces sp. SID14478]